MLCFVGCVSLGLHNPEPPARPSKVENYLNSYYYLAVEVNQKTGIPIPLILGVAGLESNWGASDLAKFGNNHFGIKSKDWAGQTYCKDTQEDIAGQRVTVNACFRKYTFIRDSYFDFGNFLMTRPKYDSLFRIPPENIEDWAHGLWYCGYATDYNYGFKVYDTIQKYRLAEFKK